MIIKHQCPDCESKYTLEFIIEDCEDDPIYCPFCSSYILLEGDELQDDED